MIMNIYVQDKDFFASLTFDQEMLVQRHCTPFNQRLLCRWSMKRLGKEKGIYGLDKDLTNWIIMTNFWNCFKVTSHPLSNGTLWVRYEPDWAKGEKLMSDEQIKKQTDHYKSYIRTLVLPTIWNHQDFLWMISCKTVFFVSILDKYQYCPLNKFFMWRQNEFHTIWL